MSKVTVITSCFNGEKYLKHYLRSVKNQDFKEFLVSFQHVLPSRNESNILRKKSSDIKIKIVTHQKQISLPEAWNNSINSSDSDFFCIWNVDDLRTPDSLGSMVSVLETNKELGFVYGNYYIVDKIGKKKGGLIDESGRENELTSGMILGPFFMFRSNIINKIGLFDEQLLSGADYDFAMRLGRFSSGKHINSVLGYYLNEGSGLSTKENSLQEIERTVVELRYNLKVTDTSLISIAKEKYKIDLFKFGGSYLNISKYLP